VSRLVPPGAPNRFDLLLLVVPLAFAVGLLATAVSSVSVHVAGAASSLASAVALLDGTALRPPT
jgi:hypothetical protein